MRNRREDYTSLGFPTREMYQFPNIINVEVYRGNCPCRCVHCPVGTTEPGKRQERFGDQGIKLELYRKILDEISEYPHSTLRIHSAGEPLMWNNLVDALRLTHEASVRSWIFTCAVTDDMSLLEALCEYADIVEVSVNSTTPEDYTATKGIDAFTRVCNNIQYMYHYIIRRKLSTRLITSRVQSIDKKKDEEFVRFWTTSGLVDDAFVRTYHTYNDLMGELNGDEISQKHSPCLVHWARCNISVKGFAVVCFNELFKEHVDPLLILGDVSEQTIAEIWHGPKLTALRQAELRGNYTDLAFRDVLPCKECYSCQPLYGNTPTSEHQIQQIIV